MYLSLIAVFFSLILFVSFASAQEFRSFHIPENSIQAFEIPLQRGDELEFSILLEDKGVVEFSIEMPNREKIIFGEINDFFDSSIIADSEGMYRFIFDNSILLEESKQLDFEFTITKVRFDIYVDEFPDSGIDIKRTINEAFEFWKRQYVNMEFNYVETPQEANLNIQFVRDFGTEHIGYALGSRYIEVGLGDNGCRDKWQPYSEKHVTHIIKHEIGHILGLEHSDNPENVMFSVNQGKEYGVINEEHVFAPGYGQFIPLCTDKDISAFSFKVNTDDPNYGFDVYTIPSVESFNNWSKGKSFTYYFSEECNTVNKQTFFGECHGITLGSGLLVITNEDQTNPLTKINIKTREIPSEKSQVQKTQITELKTVDKNKEKEIESQPVCGDATKLVEGQCIPVESKADNLSNGGGCLIATATYGSEMAPQVQQLRELRDNTVLSTESGMTFMTGFNQVYYSFSPYIADYERENPAFKELVKIGITPLLASLNVMSLADSESEILGYGIAVILMNLGMYVAAPAMLVYGINKKIRKNNQNQNKTTFTWN